MDRKLSPAQGLHGWAGGAAGNQKVRLTFRQTSHVVGFTIPNLVDYEAAGLEG